MPRSPRPISTPLRSRRRLVTLLALSWLVIALAPTARALTTVTGTDAVTAYFDPNRTHPRLQLGGPGSVENAGGVAVFSLPLGSPSFTLEVDFLSASGPDTYSDLILTTALDPLVDYSGVEIRLGLGGDLASVSVGAGDFVEASAFGLPFPPGGIRGIGNGAGEFLSLNGARVAGFDLMTDLTRGVNVPLALAMQVSGLSSSDQIIRFDVFGLDAQGRTIIGNNPNSGAAGVAPIPEPSAVVLFALGAGLVARSARRRTARADHRS